MEEQIRKIVREEIARALGAMSDVAETATPGYAKESDRFALQAIRSVTQRVARDVLANVHPEAEAEPAVHTITDVPERAHTITDTRGRPRPACTCSGHVHMMGRDNLCAHPRCRCWTPVRARGNRPEHTEARVHVSEHIAGTEVPRACTVCLHGEHDQGRCGMHVYVDGVARPCPCLASRTVRSTSEHTSTRPGISCTVCSHAPHGAGNCRYAVASGACLCTGSALPCTCPGGLRKAVNGQCQMCGHKAHASASCTGKRSFE